MTLHTALKLGQIVGALVMAAGVAACVARDRIESAPILLLAGGTIYGLCRITAWLRTPPK